MAKRDDERGEHHFEDVSGLRCSSKRVYVLIVLLRTLAMDSDGIREVEDLAEVRGHRDVQTLQPKVEREIGAKS